MPREKSKEELPKGVKDVLPEHAQEIYREAHNNALEQYKDPKKRRGNASLEEVVHKVAWAAVKKNTKRMKRPGSGRENLAKIKIDNIADRKISAKFVRRP